MLGTKVKLCRQWSTSGHKFKVKQCGQGSTAGQQSKATSCVHKDTLTQSQADFCFLILSIH